MSKAERRVFTDFRVGDAVQMRDITPESLYPHMANWRGTVVEITRAGASHSLGYAKVHWHTVDSKGRPIDAEMGMEFFEIKLHLGPDDLPAARDCETVEAWLSI